MLPSRRQRRLGSSLPSGGLLARGSLYGAKWPYLKGFSIPKGTISKLASDLRCVFLHARGGEGAKAARPGLCMLNVTLSGIFGPWRPQLATSGTFGPPTRQPWRDVPGAPKTTLALSIWGSMVPPIIGTVPSSWHSPCTPRHSVYATKRVA